MKIQTIIGCIALMLLLASPCAFAQQENQAVVDYSMWVGAHYTGFEDYAKKIGEYRRIEDEALPEFIINLNARKKDGYLNFDGRYFDHKNIFAKVTGKKSDRVDLSLMYRSLIHQDGQDFLANMEAREWLGTKPGGKMVTHELTDLNADYSTDRHEVQTNLRVKLSRKGNVRLSVAHRSIFEKGNEQKVATSHCFSCHLESKEWDVDNQTHQVEAGLEAEVQKFEVGYFFGYRKFESKVADPEAEWDVAKHPVNGGAGAEFGSRVIYDGEVLNFGIYPNTEKMSHTGRIRGKLWKGRLAGSFTHSHVENERSSLGADAMTGALSYGVAVSKKSRVVAKFNALRLDADNVFIDLPTWREGRPDNNPVNFDYMRYSSLGRIEGKGTLEFITRVNPKTTLSVLGGYKQTGRDEYPTPATTYTTKQYIGQAKVRYREGMKFSGTAKYRYERTKDPLRSDRGLLEASGREVLDFTSPSFAFYYQREDLRFLGATSLPTDYHEVDLRTTVRPKNDLNMSIGLKTIYDTNSDLDTLDVMHYSIQPNFNLTVLAAEGLTFNGGYTFNYGKSRGPITVPIFDG